MTTKFCTQCGTRLETKARFCTACGTAVSSTGPSRSSRSQKQVGKSFPWPILLLIVGPILIALAVGISLYSDDSTTTVDIPDEHDASGLPYPEVPRISAAETKEKFDSSTAVIVDVRSSEEYAEAHITNAISMPMGELQVLAQELAPNTEIILYCTWPSEESSARAAAILIELGYTDVKALRGGLEDWEEAGYPTASGS